MFLKCKSIYTEVATGGVLKKRCSQKFSKIQRKTPVPEHLIYRTPLGDCFCIYPESLFNTRYIEIKQKFLKKFPPTKYTVQKMHPFFFCELPLITVLLLICHFCMSCMGFSIFDSASFLLSLIFYIFIDPLTLKRLNSFQN